MTKKILWLSDFDFSGSGYYYISAPLCSGLSELGYEVKAIGLGYRGQPHNFDFSIIPCQSFQDAHAMIHNLNHKWQFDVLVIALDIPQQLFFAERLRQEGIKHIAITPLENPPLTKTWMMGLSQLEWTFFISEISAQAAQDAGLKNSSHIRIGVDTEAWRLPTKDERERVRKSMGIDNKFVILTVADNQERKNPAYGYDIVSKVKQAGVPVLYLHVTREHNPQGLNLRDYAEVVGLKSQEDYRIIERGIPSSELMALYWASDVFLLPTKAEGLGLPVLEAMACGTPVVATDTGAIHELLVGGRGYYVPSEYSFIDVWGNSKRDMIDKDTAANCIEAIHSNREDAHANDKLARKYVEERTWTMARNQLEYKIKEVCNGQNK